MSGYRNIHREELGSFPIWQIQCSPILRKGGTTSLVNQAQALILPTTWRIWLACGDGLVRGYLITEKTLAIQTDVLDASACTCVWTHALMGKGESHRRMVEQGLLVEEEKQEVRQVAIGCSQVQVARNYVGDDDTAGDLIVLSLDIVGTVRIWVLEEDMDQNLSNSNKETMSGPTPVTPKVRHEFQLKASIGTVLRICPPKVSGVGDVLIALPCLDGTIAIVATGVVTPTAKTTPIPPGTIMERWSKGGSIALSTSWHPVKKVIAVGRQDGLVEILGDRSHRLIQHESPVRVVEFTPDGALLATAGDDGMLCVWDTLRVVPVLIHHVVQAHSSWILSLATLSDSRRFVTTGADCRINVWSAGQMNQPLHSFTSDSTAWTVHAQNSRNHQQSAVAAKTPPRLVSGSENGGIQIFSLEP
jgi:WD40 repeat protein